MNQIAWTDIGTFFIAALAFLLGIYQLWSSNRKAHQQLRVYISATMRSEWVKEERRKEGTFIYFHPRFQNHGQTPAENITWAWGTYVHGQGEEVFDREKPHTLTKTGYLKQTSHLGTKDDPVEGVAGFYTEALEDLPFKAMDSNKVICLYGRVVYKDVWNLVGAEICLGNILDGPLV